MTRATGLQVTHTFCLDRRVSPDVGDLVPGDQPSSMPAVCKVHGNLIKAMFAYCPIFGGGVVQPPAGDSWQHGRRYNRDIMLSFFRSNEFNRVLELRIEGEAYTRGIRSRKMSVSAWATQENRQSFPLPTMLVCCAIVYALCLLWLYFVSLCSVFLLFLFGSSLIWPSCFTITP